MDSKKVQVKKTRDRGDGVFATELIKKDELIAEFDGQVYDYSFTGWNDDLYNHCIQFEKRKWRDSKGIARMINHSCEPNCGIKNLFHVVAMRDILPDEEILWDYEMTENYHWRMKCGCESKYCRGEIGAYKNMPQKVRDKYKGYISEWLLK